MVGTFLRCQQCLYPNTKPDLWFDAHGACSACLAYEARRSINWPERERQFLDLVRAHPGKTHDVIVACSGGKDSTAQVVKCLELGLRPLAVTASTDHLSAIGRRNLDNISTLCDHVEVTVHKPTRAKIAKFALTEVGDISWAEHHLIWSVPAREAVARGIPIVLYGECPQNEYGAGPAGSETQERLTHSWVHEFGGLLGLRLEDLSDLLDIERRHLDLYRYPADDAGSVQAVFMGSYFPWDGYANFLTAKDHGFESRSGHIEGSLYGYENLDNLQTGIHDRLRWLKFGFSRACDIASSHIRRGKLDREEAAAIVHGRERRVLSTSYLGVPIRDILAKIDVTMAEFAAVCERFTNGAVVEWASRPESFRCFCGTSAAPSKAANSTPAAA